MTPSALAVWMNPELRGTKFTLVAGIEQTSLRMLR